MAKTANVMVRVEPEIKEKAEDILSQLGVPASLAVNMFYRQIILTGGIPFDVAVPSAPVALEDMDKNDFDKMMTAGMNDVAVRRGALAEQIFAALRNEK